MNSPASPNRAARRSPRLGTTVRRGDLRITIPTAGRAPALSKRLRRELETMIDDAYGGLVDALATARERTLPRNVDFKTWAGRWEEALDDLHGLVDLLRSGQHDEVTDRVAATIRPDLSHASSAAPSHPSGA